MNPEDVLIEEKENQGITQVGITSPLVKVGV